MSFYTSKTDGNIKNDIISQEFDMYLRPIDYQDNATVDNSTPSATVVTPTSTYDTTNDVGKTMVIEGNSYSIDTVDGTTWTIDTSSNSVSGDETSIEVVGSRVFFGLTNTKSFTDNKEYKEFENAGEVIRKDLKKRTITMKGVSQTVPNDLIREVFGLKDDGTRTEGSITYSVATGGSKPSPKHRWQIELVGANVNCKTIIVRLFNCEINSDGDLALDPDEYTTIGFMADVFVDYARKSNSTACGGTEDADLFEYLQEQ